MLNKQIFRVDNQTAHSTGTDEIRTKMQNLVDELNQASDAYYNGKEIMSNKEFDTKFDELKKLEEESDFHLENSPTHNVGADVVDFLPKFKHPYPALSLDKTKNIDEFVSKFKKGIADSGDSNNFIVLMYKEDGSTVQVYYKHGKLDKLVTRGNGEIGSIITHNVNVLSGLPTQLPYDIDLVVRGEAVMSYQEFERINSELPEDQKYANPRNLAAATLTMLDANEASNRHLMFQAFNLVDASSDLGFAKTDWGRAAFKSSFLYRLSALEEVGFNVVPLKVCTVDELADAVKEMTADIINYDYPVDGLVAAMDNYAYSSKLEGTEHHPNIMQGYAFKWADETKETILRKIEWSPSRTGRLNPVAIFDPIGLEGTVVTRASLHNLSIMKKMRIHVGNRLSVYKSNMIIPYVNENLDYDSEPDYSPEFVQGLIGCCPTCGVKAEINVSSEGIETVCCPNSDCPEKLIGKLVNFCSRDAMDIQGMSEETIKKLVDNGFIKEYADFFYLKDKPEIASLSGFGQVSWNNMCQAAEKARSTDFVRFIVALSIPDIGKGQAKTLLKYINEHYDELRPKTQIDVYNPVGILIYMGQSNFDFAKINGFGDITARGLRAWIWNHMLWDTPEARVYSAVNFTDVRPQKVNNASPVSGKSFCITGKLNQFANRQELVDKIESLGGKWVDSVSSKTDYLINNDVTSTSGKNKKAKELNIPIISEADFVNMTE